MHHLTRKSLRTLAVLIALGLLCVPAAASAYELMTVPQFGCNAVRWPAAHQPAPYYINEAGYSGLALSTVSSTMQQSFAVWGAPCCSSFSASYKGTTPDDTFTSRNVVHFYEDGWPSTLGDVNSTIGAAIPLMSSNCEITAGDIAFNATAFTFMVGDPDPSQSKHADLMSIAVHEIGHFLGLDHVSDPDATMNTLYSNGLDERTLAQDDEDGVCYLYHQGCPCTSNADCSSPEVCLPSWRCGLPACSSSSPCPSGYSCVSSNCVQSGTGGDVSVVDNGGVVEKDGGCCAIGLRAKPRSAHEAWWLVLALVAGGALVRRRRRR